jgi:pyrroloquinoline-quinone synthase
MESPVDPKLFQTELDARVAPFDLLVHPFHQAWNAGTLSQEQLRAHAQEYFHFISAFPTFLSALHCRLHDGGLRRAVLRNLAEEEVEGRAHADMWLDFAEGVGLSPEEVRNSEPSRPIRRLIDRFARSARQESPAQVLAAFYAYESQMPRLCGEKARALISHYGADSRTTGFFVLHSYADTLQAQVWRSELLHMVVHKPALADSIYEGAERFADWLWQALDASQAYRLCEGSERSMTA